MMDITSIIGGILNITPPEILESYIEVRCNECGLNRIFMKETKTVQSYKNTAAQKNRSTEKNTKSGFADPDRIKEQNPEDKPKDGVKSPWDFRCPQYDQRSSNFVNAGTHYGVGIRQPIGHEGNPKQFVDVLPQGRKNTLQDDDLG